MDAALNWLWQGCVVALASFAMLRLLERARANVRYAVCWAALMLVVALPALPGIGLPPQQDVASGFTTGSAIVSVPDAWWASDAVMTFAWMMWTIVYIGRFAWAMLELRRARMDSRPFPIHVESELSHWRHLRDEGRGPTLVVSEAVTTAAVLGCGQPMIAVAPSLIATLDADELDRVVIHEWAHVQRRDDLVNLLQVLLRAVVGWHPAVWWIDRRLSVEREIACDEVTIEVIGSAKSYAACLVKLAALKGGERTALPAPAVLTAPVLRERVTRIVSRHALIAPLWARGIATAIVSMLCVVSVGVGGLTLVEASVLALPFDSLRAAGARHETVAPVAMPTVASRIKPVPPPRQTVTPPRSARRPIAEEPPVATAPPPSSREQRITVPEGAVDSSEEHAAGETPADPVSVRESSTAVAAAPDEPPVATAGDSRTVSSVAAGAGIAIGQKSKEAGVATAGFFTRVARRVAGSF
jgi:beta-lactamase regulating signal transducer with metallopeptidase domain